MVNPTLSVIGVSSTSISKNAWNVLCYIQLREHHISHPEMDCHQSLKANGYLQSTSDFPPTSTVTGHCSNLSESEHYLPSPCSKRMSQQTRMIPGVIISFKSVPSKGAIQPKFLHVKQLSIRDTSSWIKWSQWPHLMALLPCVNELSQQPIPAHTVQISVQKQSEICKY